MKKIYFPYIPLPGGTALFLFFALAFTDLRAQSGPELVHGHLTIGGVATSSDHVPFWFQANQYGSIPLPGTSASAIGSIHKDYDTLSGRLVDWGAGVEGREDLGSGSRFTLIEGYGKLRVGIFELKAGRSKEIMGLVDTSLSSGAFAISGNALGIPKVQLSIPDYYALPFWGQLFAIKGNYAHGWLGNLPIQYGHLADHATTWFHQKSLYLRFGRPDWSWRLYGGFNHQVFWGNERSVFGKGFTLSTPAAYWHVVSGTTWNYSKVGNHLGSIDFGAEVDLETVRISFYRLNFYDEGALYHLANIKDGLNGLSIQNLQESNGGFHWNKFLFEFLYTVNQAGEPSSRYTNSGDENYYNNYEYSEGWSYKGRGLGTPFISTRESTRQGLPNDTSDYFNNNRVAAFHVGLQASLGTWDFTGKFSLSLNYGTYGTSTFGHSTGLLRVPPHFGIFQELGQFSSFLQVRKEVRPGWVFGCIAALDKGDLLNNSNGLILSLSRTF